MGAFKAAAIFTNHMVFQRGKPINIWGTDYDKNTITVTFCGNSVNTKVRNHKWSVVLPPIENYGGPYSLNISNGSENIQFEDIFVGEVWLAGGQSNMEFELQSCKNGKETLENIADSNVRFYYTKKNAYFDDFFYSDEYNNCWKIADKNDSKCWSAVGFFFADKLSKELNCKVGVIGCNWGGTSASAWMSKDKLLSDEDTKSYVDELDAAMEGKTIEQYDFERNDYFDWEEIWQPKINEFYSSHPDGTWDEAQEFAGKCRYPEPLGPKSPFRAAGLYETMIKRVCPYTLGGFIYYQGESDDHKPDMYYKLFNMLIENWREDWDDDTLPFIFAQLTMHMNKGEPDYKHWCKIREAQLRTHLTVANTGMAVITDAGEYGNIHPLDKQTPGERLALQALYHVYKKINAVDAYGPLYKYSTFEESNMVLYFDYADGMHFKDNKACGFEIAGSDKVYHDAEAEIIGNTVVLKAEGIDKPCFARYNWTNYGEVSLFGGNGIPASPFRTSRKDS